MIGQYLSQTNESATVPVLQKFFETKQGLTDTSAGSSETKTGINLLFSLHPKTFYFILLNA